MRERDFGSSDVDGGAKARLRVFVIDVIGTLDDLLFDYEDSKLIIPELLEEARRAWPDVKKNGEKLSDHIRSLSETSLISHGLGGFELNFKLSAVRTLLKRFLQSRAAPALVKLLEAIDATLDSLIKAAGQGERLKEMKDVLMAAVA